MLVLNYRPSPVGLVARTNAIHPTRAIALAHRHRQCVWCLVARHPNHRQTGGQHETAKLLEARKERTQAQAAQAAAASEQQQQQTATPSLTHSHTHTPTQKPPARQRTAGQQITITNITYFVLFLKVNKKDSCKYHHLVYSTTCTDNQLHCLVGDNDQIFATVHKNCCIQCIYLLVY